MLPVGGEMPATRYRHRVHTAFPSPLRGGSGVGVGWSFRIRVFCICQTTRPPSDSHGTRRGSHLPRKGEGKKGGATESAQRLLDVCYEVIGMLDADGEADEVVGHRACGALHRFPVFGEALDAA
jgi:hypothetical protein